MYFADARYVRFPVINAAKVPLSAGPSAHRIIGYPGRWCSAIAIPTNISPVRKPSVNIRQLKIVDSFYSLREHASVASSSAVERNREWFFFYILLSTKATQRLGYRCGSHLGPVKSCVKGARYRAPVQRMLGLPMGATRRYLTMNESLSPATQPSPA